jgi:hypothetical protein
MNNSMLGSLLVPWGGFPCKVLWGKFQFIHSFTSTSSVPLHGTMLGVWRKTLIPHRNRRQKTLQTPNATRSSSSIVENLKPPHPQKEKKLKHTNPLGRFIDMFVSSCLAVI